MIAAPLLACLLSLAQATPSAARAPEASTTPAAAAPAVPELAGLPDAAPGVTAADIEALRQLAVSGTPASLPPVTARMFTTEGRLEVSPLINVSVGDPFFRSVMLGVRAEQHLSERWSVGGHLFAGTSMVAAPVQLCGASACAGPVADRLRSTPGDLMAALGVQATFRPVYGKLSLLGEKTVHFDLYVALGPELLRERIAPDAASEPRSRWDLGGRASIGEHLYFSDRLSVRFAVSELIYGARVRGRIEPERKLMIEGGVSFLFGAR
jgi:outer membrane beta-barrel protein